MDRRARIAAAASACYQTDLNGGKDVVTTFSDVVRACGRGAQGTFPPRSNELLASFNVTLGTVWI